MISGAASAVSGISDLLCLSTPLQDAAGSIGRRDKVAQQSLKLFRLLQPKNFISKIPKPFSACSAGADTIVYDHGLLLLAGLV